MAFPLVTIENRTGLGRGTKVISKETGEEVHGIKTLSIEKFGAGDAIYITAEIFVAEMEIDGLLRMRAIDPKSGEFKDVKRIEFADGSVFEC